MDLVSSLSAGLAGFKTPNDFSPEWVTTFPGSFSAVAATCFFYPSIQHYSGYFVNGKFTEDKIGDPSPLRPTRKGQTVVPDTFPDTDIVNGFNELLWYWGFSDPCIVDNVVYTNTSTELSSVPGGLATLGDITGPKRCFYGLNYNWRDIFGTIGGMAHSNYILGLGENIEHAFCERSGNYTSMVCDEWWLSKLFNGGNATIGSISAYMDAGFKSFSEQMRIYGTDWDHNPLIASGIVMETTVCTKFNGVWLVYPLALLVGTVVLFIATSVTSSGMFGYAKEAVWKTTVLPLLFYGLEPEFQKPGLKLATAKELSETAKKLKVDFSAKGDGWRFHAAEKKNKTEQSQEDSHPEEARSHLG
ncbi:hypothetical protein PG999_012357 [Apiospora kogelbergensis]|uniref:Uncharacterized protein n=1 Tax=Apiospora kogelbergensis TaxID=1337665 RepID=A0AAW0QU62_9PEZI